MRTLFTLLLTALAVTSGLAGSGSQEEGASLTWTGGNSTGEVTVVIDGYTHNSILTSGDSVPLGTQIILVCPVVGLPYGTPLSYTWTCLGFPHEQCEMVNAYSRKFYSEHILALNITSTLAGGTYTCQVTATGGQEATGSFTLRVIGGRVVHSNHRIIPHQFLITSKHKLSFLRVRPPRPPTLVYGITCTVSSGPPPPRFYSPNGTLDTGGVTQHQNAHSRTLEWDHANIETLQNRDIYCDDNVTNYFYLYLTSSDNIPSPGVTVPCVTSSQVEYETTAHGSATRVIAGYEVTRFGVPMIGQYVNTGRGRRVTISPAIPGARYRITAWALGDGGRSATPAVVVATTREADPSPPRNVTVTRVFQGGVELNWLPPTEPNGEVRYVVEYKREDSGNWTSVNTASDSTHYNLTGLHSGTSYVIRVVAVSYGRAPITPTPTSSTAEPTPTFNSTGGAVNLPAVVAGAVVAFLLLTLLIVGIIVGAVLLKKLKKKTRTLNNGEWVDEIERTEKSTEVTGRGRESAAGHSEQWADEAAFHYEQHVADMHYESTDFDGEGYCGREDGNAIGSERNQSDGVANTPTQYALEHTRMSNDQQSERPRGNPGAVYAMVDKSKKKKHKKTQGGASATTTEGADTEEQHYECSDVAGQDWLGNVVGEKPKIYHGGVGQGSPSNDAWETCPRSEPCSPTTMVVDKSKNHTGEKTQGGASATTTQEADTEEQHYECSSGFGQDWFGTVVEVNPEATLHNAVKGRSSTDTDTNGRQSYRTNAVYGMVDRSKNRIQSRKSGDLLPSTYRMGGV